MNRLFTLLTLVLALGATQVFAQNVVTFQVDMSNETVGMDGVSVAYGSPSFSGLADAIILALDDSDGDNIYTGTSDISPQDTIGYFFINGASSDIAAFESVPSECGIGFDLMGLTFNLRPYIYEGDGVLPAVCFGECGACALTDCSNPVVIIEDDASSYELGDLGASGPWELWPGVSLGIEVDTFESDNVFSIIGDPVNQDILLDLGDQTSGHYRTSWLQYIPEGSNAYFNIQHQDPSIAPIWAFDVFFLDDGDGVLQLNDNGGDGTDSEISFAYPTDAWFDVIMYFDLDNDIARLIVDERFVAQWKFSDGVASGSVEMDLLQLASVNFYPTGANHVWFFDNVTYWEIPAPADGQYCYNATTIDAGVHTVGELSCYGGGLDLGGNLVSGQSAAWYSYTPAEDGVISIGSCNGGADTRGWILTGSCELIDIVGVNDDMCAIEPDGNEWASYREAVVTGGQEYFIVWDNIWESNGFDFELTFTTDTPAEGDFCQSAQVITPGTYDIEEFTGDAAVAGPNINNTGSSTTNYSNSQWYSFTPTEAGTMTITSCVGSASDNFVFVYTGDCSTFSGLALVAANDDMGSEACESNGLASAIFDFPITPGETYYIEWIDRWSDDAFFWELIFDMEVDVDEVSFEQGVQLFPNPSDGRMTLDIQLPETLQDVELSVVNMLGSTLLTQPLGSVHTLREELDLSDLAAGTYFVQLRSGSLLVNRKVVLQ